MDFFSSTAYSAVYFNHRQVGYWSVERQKGEALSSERVGTNLSISPHNRQRMFTIIKTSGKAT